MKKAFTLFSFFFACATTALAQNNFANVNNEYLDMRYKLAPADFVEQKTPDPFDRPFNANLYSLKMIEDSTAIAYGDYLMNAMANHDDEQKNLRRDVYNLIRAKHGFIIMKYNNQYWDVNWFASIPLLNAKEVHVLSLYGAQ